MKNLKKVIAVRHGEYDQESDSLTEKGCYQSKFLAKIIRMMIGNKERSIILFTSTLNYAMETATILEKELGSLTRVESDFLEGDQFEDGEESVPPIKAIIDDKKHIDNPVIIVVTHFEAPSGIINGFSKLYFHDEFGKEKVSNCCGFILHVESGLVSRIS